MTMEPLSNGLINTSTAAAVAGRGGGAVGAVDYRIVTYFAGTHKCHPTSTVLYLLLSY